MKNFSWLRLLPFVFSLVSLPSFALINLGFASWRLGPSVKVGLLRDGRGESARDYGGGVVLPALDSQWSRNYGLGLSNHFQFSDLMLSADLSLSRKKILYRGENSTSQSSYDLTFYEIEVPVLLWQTHDLELLALRYGAGINFLRGKGKVKTYAASSDKASHVLSSVAANQSFREAGLKQNHWGLSAGLGLDVPLLITVLTLDLRYTFVPDRDTDPNDKTRYHVVEASLGALF